MLVKFTSVRTANPKGKDRRQQLNEYHRRKRQQSREALGNESSRVTFERYAAGVSISFSKSLDEALKEHAQKCYSLFPSTI
jgi:hypothetical protein